MSENADQPEAYDSDISAEEGLGDHGGSGNTPEAAQPPIKRARKSHSNGATGPVAKRKGKSRQLPGSLSELLNMPLDVFFEVAAHLHPLDMLHLSRTSKSFRSMLLAKSSRAAWIASMSSVDGLPSCPETMSEPMYAALLFDQYCFLCGADPAKWADYALRLRLCQACCKTSIRKGSAILQKAAFTDLPIFPCEIRSEKAPPEMFVLPENRTARNKYYDAQVKATIHKYHSLKQQDHEAAKRMMEETMKDVAAIHTHAALVANWFEEKRLSKQAADEQIVSERRAKITERLQALGHTEDDFPTDNKAWDKLVNQPRPLTDRIWNNIRAKLEEQLTIEAERRVREAFESRVHDRLVVIIEWYEDYLKEHLADAERNLAPNRCDAATLPSLLSLAQDNDAQGVVPYEAFASVTDQMITEIDAYKERVKRTFTDACEDPLRNPQGRDELKGLPADDVLERFFALFACRMNCGLLYVPYDELHAHWREWHADEPWFRDAEDDSYGEPLKAVILAFYPNISEAQSVLEAVGIPLDTPRSVLDGWMREGRLFCACEHPSMPLPAEMSWGKLIYHIVRRIMEHDALDRREYWGEHDPDHVLLDNHSLVAGDNCCIKFLPEGADPIAASTRTTLDDPLRALIQAKLANPPIPRAVVVCRVCKDLMSGTLRQAQKNWHAMRLSRRPEEIVWHLRSHHGKEFSIEDIEFVPRN